MIKNLRTRVRCAWSGHRRPMEMFDQLCHTEVIRECRCGKVSEARVYDKPPVLPDAKPVRLECVS